MAKPVIIPSVDDFSPISSDRVSVVIQGPILREPHGDRPTTQDCLHSIRAYLPQAEVILSTWDGSDTSGLVGFDKLITSPDPGGIWNYVKQRHNNVNRMIRSTSRGLTLASREFCLKFRTDLQLTSDRICRVDTSGERSDPYSLLSLPITITTYYVRDPSVIPMAFHPSDIVQFGRTSDLVDFWDQPQVDPQWLVRPRPILSLFGRYAGFSPMRVVPEQIVTLQWLAKRNIHIDLQDTFDISFDAFRTWEQVLLRNFRLVNASDSGVAFYARLRRKKFFTHRANFTEATFAEIGRAQSVPRLWMRWVSAALSKYLFCFFYVRYYKRLWWTYRRYRDWTCQEK
jgi:hypothetical protein